ncbi:hypothetical protein HY374_02590 [Candidatus Berkelbacteria bacterium]|nr:hypothetical protein [Candidatus Berkelbacteria bacterium]
MYSEYFRLEQAQSRQGRKVQTKRAIYVNDPTPWSMRFGGIQKRTIGTVTEAHKAFSACFGLPKAVYRLEVHFEGGGVQWFDKKEYKKCLTEI